jgi:hypothetical protein
LVAVVQQFRQIDPTAAMSDDLVSVLDGNNAPRPAR